MTDREKNMITLMLAVVILGIFAAVIGYLLYQRNQQAVIEAFGADIVNLCNPPPNDMESEANLPSMRGGSSNRKALILELNSDDLHDWHDQLPDVARATNREDIDIVFCIGEQASRSIENPCQYTDTGGPGPIRFAIERYIYYVPVVAINPINGRTILEANVAGVPPQDCPEWTRELEGSVTRMDGRDVTYAEFARNMDRLMR